MTGWMERRGRGVQAGRGGVSQQGAAAPANLFVAPQLLRRGAVARQRRQLSADVRVEAFQGPVLQNKSAEDGKDVDERTAG